MNTILHKGTKLTIKKNTFVLYCSHDTQKLSKSIYTKAAALIDTDKGFFLSSQRALGEQMALVCAAHENIDMDKYLASKLLKSDLEKLNHSIAKYFGIIEPGEPRRIRPQMCYEDIAAYAPAIDYAFIENIHVKNDDDIAYLRTLQQISKELSIRIEAGVVCDPAIIPQIKSFATVSGV